MNIQKVLSVLKRFVKGALAGAATALGLVSVQVPHAWSDFPSIISTLGLAAAGGAITGAILAFEKWANWTDTASDAPANLG